MSERHDVSPGHETSDVGMGAVVLGSGVLFALVFLAVVAMWGMFEQLGATQASRGSSANPLLAEQRRLPPEPRLQANPIEDLAELRNLEDSELTSYGWVDRSTGRVRIPIDNAMERLADSGGRR